MKQPAILLQSAWDTLNIGDIGHTPGTLRILEEHLPEAKITLWARHLNEAITAMLKRRFPNVEILQGEPDGTEPRDELLREALQRADFFIRNSGMGQETGYMSYCESINKPWGLYGQSYFPSMVEGEGAAERKALLNKASFIFCRETKTLEILKSAGVRPGTLEFAPDGCFGIDVRDDESAERRMRKLGLQDRKFITIELRTHTAKHEGVHNPPLNPLYPTPEQIADDERRAEVYRELITLWVKKTGYKVLISPEAKKELYHNKRLLYDLLPQEIRSHVVNLDSFWNVDEAASVFARAHTVVCHEPHSPIISLANGTPILHTYSEFHSPKCWMFQDIGLGEWLLEFDSTPAEQMFEVLMEIERDYEAAKAKVRKAMETVRSRQHYTMECLIYRLAK